MIGSVITMSYRIRVDVSHDWDNGRTLYFPAQPNSIPCDFSSLMTVRSSEPLEGEDDDSKVFVFLGG